MRRKGERRRETEREKQTEVDRERHTEREEEREGAREEIKLVKEGKKRERYSIVEK